MKLAIKKATTDVTLYVFIADSSQTDGRGLTSLAYNSASLVASYVRPLGSRTAITLATQTVTGAHSDGGFVEVDSTNMPGVYRLDLPDAVCATGVNSVVVMLKGASNMAPVVLELELVAYDPQDAVRLGLTALPNATPAGSGGLPTVDGSNRVAGIQGTITTLDALDTAQDSQHSTTQSAISGLSIPTAGAIADQVWEEAIADHSGTAGSTAEALGAAGSAGDPWTTALPGAYGSGTAGKIVGDALDAAVSSRAVAGDAMALTSGERTTLAGVIWNSLTSGMTTAGSIGKKLADWTIHSAADVWAVATRVLTAGTNIVLAKGTGVTGFNDLSAAQVNAEADTALADYDAPTKAELDAGLGALNDLDATEVQSAAAAALAAYDPPTRTELTSDISSVLSAIGALNDPTAAAVAAAVLAAGDIDGYSLEEAQKLQLAALCGVLAGAGGTTVTIEAADGSKTRITATVDSSGNRSSLTLDETG